MAGPAPGGNISPLPGPPYQRMPEDTADQWCEGCSFPLAWRQAEPHRAIVGCPYLRKFRLPQPEEAAPQPWSHLSLPPGS